MMPGLPRSATVCGNTPSLPSARRKCDTGAQYALCEFDSPIVPPAARPRRIPSPLSSAHDRRMARNRRRQEPRAQLGVVREAAAGEHHPGARAERLAPAVRFDLHSGGAAIAHHDADHARVEAQRHLQVERGLEQPPDQRVAEHQPRAARREHPLPGVLRHQARDARRRARRGKHRAEVRQVRARDHHAAEQHEFGQRPAHQREVAPELRGVEIDRLEHAPAERRAGQLRVVVRVVQSPGAGAGRCAPPGTRSPPARARGRPRARPGRAPAARSDRGSGARHRRCPRSRPRPSSGWPGSTPCRRKRPWCRPPAATSRAAASRAPRPRRRRPR